MKNFLRFFLAWYFPILGTVYFIFLVIGSERIADRINLLTPALAVLFLYFYHIFVGRKRK